jgi:pimeloyl-ACP methyl ester carboxylesterase
MACIFANTSLRTTGEFAMTHTLTSNLLKVPGATLYYERRGSGPLLLLIPGEPGDAGSVAALAERLARDFTVVAYDPRGTSRSIVDPVSGSVLAGPRRDRDVDVHTDDAARLIDALSDGPALVFGTSGGGQVGLHLAARAPGKLRAVVAHEPPCISLLPDAATVQTRLEEIQQSYLRNGASAAIQQLRDLAGLESGPPAAPVDQAAADTAARVASNFDDFVAHGVMPLARFQPDIDALRRTGVTIVIGIGATSGGQLAHRASTLLARLLGTTPVIFPGGHAGYRDHADGFASILEGVLTRRHDADVRSA